MCNCYAICNYILHNYSNNIYFMIIKGMLYLTITEKYNCDATLFPVDQQDECNINSEGTWTIEVAVIYISRV